MKNKIVLVTGADGGLGRHVTHAFLDAGARVSGTARKITQSDFPGENFLAIPADISSLAVATKVVEHGITTYGKLDVLVHAIGGFAGGQSVAETADETFQKMLDVNLNSLFHMLRAAVPELRKSKGSIIAIGSRQALEPGAGVGAYSASKAAMLSLVKTVAIENQDAGVTANVILPGTMDTPVNRKAMPTADFSKWVNPGAVADLALWLAGESAKEITAAAIPMYGAS